MYLTTARKITTKRLNICMKVIQDPLKTTVKGLTDANVRVAVDRIQKKILMYGICSDREQEYLDKYTSGQTDQKKVFT